MTHLDLSIAVDDLSYSDCRFANFFMCLSLMVFLTDMDWVVRNCVKSIRVLLGKILLSSHFMF